MKKLIMALGLLAAFVVVLYIAVQVYVQQTTVISSVVQKPIILEKSPRNATYIIDDLPITLKNGLSDVLIENSSRHIVTKYFGKKVVGDLDGDMRPDTAFILTQSKGGSAIFYYVVVGFDTPSRYRGSNAILLGDRIVIDSLLLKGERISANYAVRQRNEPVTLPPSHAVTKYIYVKSGQLGEIK
jgi:hypothetical protein